MGWNGSENRNAAPVPKKTVKTPPSKWRGLIALAVIVVGGFAAWLALRPAASEPESKRETRSTKRDIAEVKPQIATNKVAEADVREEPVLSERERQLKYYRDKYGDNLPANLKPVVYYLENPPKQTFHPARTRASIFKRRSDRALAALLLVPPGASMLRCPTYDESFDDEFKESLAEKIEISDDDSVEDKELKQAVSDVREELARRMRAGETPSALINNEYEALYSLGQYKSDLSEQLSKIEDDENYSDNDLQDFVTAANQMLEQKGLPGFEMPNLLIRQMQLEMAAQKRFEAENNQGEQK